MSSKFQIGDVVVLNTKFFEQNNPRISKYLFTFNSNEKNFDVSFQPPYMSVVEITENTTETPEVEYLHEQHHNISNAFIKCMWYNHNQNEYATQIFPEEILLLASESDEKTERIDIFLQSLFVFGLGFALSWFFKSSNPNQ